jgi:ABC-type phosphate transport system permease subunit
MTRLERNEKLTRLALLLVAFSAVSILLVITIFIFSEGTPVMFRYGLQKFLFGLDWFPLEKSYGLLPMIIGSLFVTAGALIIELLAGIPSVVYGFMGVVILVPFIRDNLGGPGLSVLAASIILGIMILPTVISISIDSLEAVPRSYREGSIALGATRWQTTRMVMFPAAKSGIIASIILGMGRAIGETMAVIMIAGNAAIIPRSLLDPVRTLTSNIALEMGYAAGEHREALFATGVILFIIIMVLNTIANLTSKRRTP